MPAFCAGVGAARTAPTLLPPVEPAGPEFWTCVEAPASAPPVVAPLAPDGEVKAEPTLLAPVEPCWADAANGNTRDATTIRVLKEVFILISITRVGRRRNSAEKRRECVALVSRHRLANNPRDFDANVHGALTQSRDREHACRLLTILCGLSTPRSPRGASMPLILEGEPAARLRLATMTSRATSSTSPRASPRRPDPARCRCRVPLSHPCRHGGDDQSRLENLALLPRDCVFH